MSRPFSTKTAKDKDVEQGKDIGQRQKSRRGPMTSGAQAKILALQDTAGNQAVRHMLESDVDGLGLGGDVIPPIVHSVLRRSGEPLDPGTRTLMETRFGSGVGQVRIHTGSKAAQSAQSVDAQAYTVGQHVVFDTNQYQPFTRSGLQLLSHELVHTLQQHGQSQYTLFASGKSHQDSQFEREAKVISQNPDSNLSVSTAPVSLQRKERDQPDQAQEAPAQSYDYPDALEYIQNYYVGVRAILNSMCTAELTGIDLFDNTTDIPNAPDVARGIIITALGAAFEAVGGWDIIQRGITRGVFAVNIGRQRRLLGELIGSHGTELLISSGPTRRERVIGGQLTDLVKHTTKVGGEAATRSAQATKTTESGRQRQTSRTAREKSLIECATFISGAIREERIVRDELHRLRDKPELQGQLLEYFRTTLGPSPSTDGLPAAVEEAAANVELQLYKSHFGGRSTDSPFLEMRKYEYWGVVTTRIRGGGWSDAIQHRIAELQGWSSHEVERIAQWLDLPTRSRLIHHRGTHY